MKRRGLGLVALSLGLVGLVQAAQAGYIHAKAALAQVLIHQAWVEARKNYGSPKPWPWADTTPVARLGAPAQDADLMVLEGGSGRTLAFGPGHVIGTARPGERGNVVIGGHRDTHFSFLKDLKRDDRLWLQAMNGEVVDYAVVSLDVVDHQRGDLQRDFGDDRLTLITCYPFDAIRPGGPERYVVTALRCGGPSGPSACPPEPPGSTPYPVANDSSYLWGVKQSRRSAEIASSDTSRRPPRDDKWSAAPRRRHCEFQHGRRP